MENETPTVGKRMRHLTVTSMVPAAVLAPGGTIAAGQYSSETGGFATSGSMEPERPRFEQRWRFSRACSCVCHGGHWDGGLGTVRGRAVPERPVGGGALMVEDRHRYMVSSSISEEQ